MDTSYDVDLELALTLQQEDAAYCETDLDLAIALSLQEEDRLESTPRNDEKETMSSSPTLCSPIRTSTCKSGAYEFNYFQGENNAAFNPDSPNDTDYQFALSQAKQDNETATNSSITGRAWKFVHSIMKEQELIAISEETLTGLAQKLTFETIGVDDMMYTVERLLEYMATFQKNKQASTNTTNDAIRIDIGYHFTRQENLENIKSNGLLTKADRERNGVNSNFNGSSWGDGVYTANNPFVYENYGDTDLLVARFLGVTNDATRCGHDFVGDTAIAQKGAFAEMVILRNSDQCVPLLKFKRPRIPNTYTDRAIWSAHSRLQGIVDTFLNGLDSGQRTAVRIIERPPAKQRGTAIATQAQLAPMLNARRSAYFWKKQRKAAMVAGSQRKLEQSPCHSETFSRQARNDRDSPGEEYMRAMYFSKEKLSCDSVGTIVIVYRFMGTDISRWCHRMEYLPDTHEGRSLLTRLKHAFLNHSLDPVTWALIPHRPSPYLSCKNHFQECQVALRSLENLCKLERNPTQTTQFLALFNRSFN